MRSAARVRALWAVNAVAFTAPPSVVRAVAMRPDVRLVVEDTPVAMPAPEPASASASSPNWNIQRIGADVVWSAGNQGQGVRVGVKNTGCSGLAYVLEIVDELAPEDVVFTSHGVNVIVDPKSLAYIDGTEMDFVKEGLNEGFKFRNPKQ